MCQVCTALNYCIIYVVDLCLESHTQVPTNGLKSDYEKNMLFKLSSYAYFLDFHQMDVW